MVSDVSARVTMGASAGLTLLYTGGIGSCGGRKFCAAFIACQAARPAEPKLWLRTRLRTNRRVMTDAPSELVEIMWFRPGPWPRCRSSGALTAEATTSGLPPG